MYVNVFVREMDIDRPSSPRSDPRFGNFPYGHQSRQTLQQRVAPSPCSSGNLGAQHAFMLEAARFKIHSCMCIYVYIYSIHLYVTYAQRPQ